MVGNTFVRRWVLSQPCRGCPCRWDFRPHRRTLHPQKAVGIAKGLKGTIRALQRKQPRGERDRGTPSVARASPSPVPDTVPDFSSQGYPKVRMRQTLQREE